MMKARQFRAREVKRSQARDIEGQDLHTGEKSDHKKIIEDENKVFSQKKKIARQMDRIQAPTDLLHLIQILAQVGLKLPMRAGVVMARKKNLQI